MSQYPYEQQPQQGYPQQYAPEQPGYQGYPQPQYPASQTGYYPQATPVDQPPQQQYPAQPQPVYYMPQPQPIQVNVTQNAGYPVRGKGINHGLHIALSFFTGGLWLLVYIPMVRSRRKHTVYLR